MFILSKINRLHKLSTLDIMMLTYIVQDLVMGSGYVKTRKSTYIILVLCDFRVVILFYSLEAGKYGPPSTYESLHCQVLQFFRKYLRDYFVF